MLHAAGVRFEIVPSSVDEHALRAELAQRSPHVTPFDVALALASAKARDVSARNLDALVIGSDQTLEVSGQMLTKPGDRDGLSATLGVLAGKTHSLHSGVALAMSGRDIWRHADTAHLTMRWLSPRFIDGYVGQAGPDLLGCVGGYQIEGLGIQLFERVQGDHFTILGMPLLPLLAQLRSEGALAA